MADVDLFGVGGSTSLLNLEARISVLHQASPPSGRSAGPPLRPSFRVVPLRSPPLIAAEDRPGGMGPCRIALVSYRRGNLTSPVLGSWYDEVL